MLCHCRLDDRKVIRPVKKLDVGLLVVTFDWIFARLIDSSTQVHLENGR